MAGTRIQKYAYFPSTSAPLPNRHCMSMSIERTPQSRGLLGCKLGVNRSIIFIPRLLTLPNIPQDLGPKQGLNGVDNGQIW